jgi:hypothetical protein
MCREVAGTVGEYRGEYRGSFHTRWGCGVS